MSIEQEGCLSEFSVKTWTMKMHWVASYIFLYPTEAIHQRILLYISVIAWAITTIVYSEVRGVLIK